MNKENRIPITTANSYYRKLFGCKVYKLSLDIGCTCPNRDGTLGTGGCIFCSAVGSGEYLEAVIHPDIVGLSIATRPDCLSDEILDVICTINRTYPVWVELGLQTIHEASAEYIRRGYTLDVYDDAMRKLSERGINVITHVILGLPNENVDMMLDSVNYVGKMSEKYSDITHGIKLLVAPKWSANKKLVINELSKLYYVEA